MISGSKKSLDRNGLAPAIKKAKEGDLCLEWFDNVRKQIKEEIKGQKSDRTLIIIYSIFLHSEIEQLLKDCFIDHDRNSCYPTRPEDALFSDNCPLGDWDSKINIAYRMGLISPRFAQDLHRVRKMRNNAAHELAKFQLDRNLIDQLTLDMKRDMPFWRKRFYEDNIRGDFKFVAELFLYIMSHNRLVISKLPQKYIILETPHKEEWIYDEKKRRNFDEGARISHERHKRELEGKFSKGSNPTN